MALRPSTCWPCANLFPGTPAVTACVRLHMWPGCSCYKDGALRSPQLHCGQTVYMELSANVAARPFTNTDVLPSPAEDLSLQQSIRLISTPVTVLTVRAGNITLPYINIDIHTTTSNTALENIGQLNSHLEFQVRPCSKKVSCWELWEQEFL